MDYTSSLDRVIHEATGHRMHDDGQAIPTVVSSNDMNMVIWSLMEVLAAGGVAGKGFNADDPDSYTRLVRAVKAIAWGTDVARPTTLAGYGIVDASSAATVVSAAGTKILTNANAGIVLINAAAGDITIKLPPVVQTVSPTFHFVRIDNTPANSVWVQGAGADTIDGAVSNTFRLVGAGDARSVKSNELAAWYTVSALLASNSAAYQSVAQSIAAATFTKISLQTKTSDAGNEFDAALYRFTAKQAGIYHVDGSVNFSNPQTAAGYFCAAFKNGAMIARGSAVTVNSTSVQAVSVVSGDIPLIAGDYLELYAYGDGAVTLASGPSATRLNIHRIR